jgi:dipeptidyl aminopeptidase/acylaminoacyl peptidase
LLGLLLSLPAVHRAETPAGLLNPPPQSLTPSPERNWENLGVRESEILVLERFHRGGGYEGFHIAYKSASLNITGILTRPYIREDEEIKYPVIILNHGSAAGVTAPYRAVALDLARRGYVVLASTYRGRAGAEGRSEGAPELAKGEVIDVLQLMALGRKLEYADSLRMGVFGDGDGAAITLQAIERSNIFRAAVVVSPLVFSGMAENGYAGMAYLRERSQQVFGRDLSDSELVRELMAREMFRNARRIRTPLLLIASNTDLNYQAQMQFVAELKKFSVEHRLLDYPAMFPDFMTAADNGGRPPNWNQIRDTAWGEVFAFFDERLKP